MGVMEHQKGNCFWSYHDDICKDCPKRCANYYKWKKRKQSEDNLK
jgi:hypothetical protein